MQQKIWILLILRLIFSFNFHAFIPQNLPQKWPEFMLLIGLLNEIRQILKQLLFNS